MVERRDALVEASLGLAWSLWGELGVSTWERNHAGWLVELEPLIGFTVFAGRHDARLLRESVDWCVQYSHFVSLRQFRHIVTSNRWPFEGPVADYGATVSAFTRRAWPNSAHGRPHDLPLSGKSNLRSLAAPSLLQLRLRALFGTGARAEIIRLLVLNPFREWSVADVADRVAYTRRQVAGDLEMLASSGLLTRGEDGGPHRYALRDVDGLRRFIGELPSVAPRWGPIFGVLLALLDADEAVTSNAYAMPDMELSRRLRLMRGSLSEGRLGVPQLAATGPSYSREIFDWAQRLFADLAAGETGFLSPDAFVSRD